ncbi:SDR family NAD(P)-dependent oxidoreductase [Aeromicrobium sp. UC242_57]|uniref:SDR family NAD(P)-dependent oxidoreductase n=1 Tax=Aeromicrobium sp. UC242_57 TaxID=3374624 RepID=UPI003795F33A
MRRGGGGAIVNIGSTTGLGATGYYAPYAASKWAVRGLTQTAAAELGQHDIRVNCVHPGVVATPFTTEPAAPGAPVLAEVFSPEPYAIARLAQPEDVTRTVVFLASDDAAFTTGAEYVVDGGLTLGPAVRS